MRWKSCEGRRPQRRQARQRGGAGGGAGGKKVLVMSKAELSEQLNRLTGKLMQHMETRVLEQRLVGEGALFVHGVMEIAAGAAQRANDSREQALKAETQGAAAAAAREAVEEELLLLQEVDVLERREKRLRQSTRLTATNAASRSLLGAEWSVLKSAPLLLRLSHKRLKAQDKLRRVAAAMELNWKARRLRIQKGAFAQVVHSRATRYKHKKESLVEMDLLDASLSQTERSMENKLAEEQAASDRRRDRLAAQAALLGRLAAREADNGQDRETAELLQDMRRRLAHLAMSTETDLAGVDRLLLARTAAEQEQREKRVEEKKVGAVNDERKKKVEGLRKAAERYTAICDVDFGTLDAELDWKLGRLLELQKARDGAEGRSLLRQRQQAKELRRVEGQQWEAAVGLAAKQQRQERVAALGGEHAAVEARLLLWPPGPSGHPGAALLNPPTDAQHRQAGQS